MIKGVQHPVRGLFLRNYLTLVSKNKLPDSGSVFEGPGGTVVDAYTFLLQVCISLCVFNILIYTMVISSHFYHAYT
jgi:hypothetical protein